MGTIQAENLLGLDEKPLDGWTLLSTTVASSDATIDIINLSSDYFMYKFIWHAVEHSAIGGFRIRTSSDNGSTWDSGVSDYAHTRHILTMEVTLNHAVSGDNADTVIALSSNMSTGTDNTGSWEITCFNPSGTEYTKLKFEGVAERNSDGAETHYMGGGVRLSAAAVNGIQFFASGGNISGTLWVYGVKA